MVVGDSEVRVEFDRLRVEHERIIEVCDDPRVRARP
jgi:hypothetical protein